MASTKAKNEDQRLVRLREDIARDRLRLQQAQKPFAEDLQVDKAGGTTVGRLYQVFVALGEA